MKRNSKPDHLEPHPLELIARHSHKVKFIHLSSSASESLKFRSRPRCVSYSSHFHNTMEMVWVKYQIIPWTCAPMRSEQWNMKAKVHGVYYSYSSLMCERKPDEKLRDGMAGRRKELACVLLLKFQMNTSVIILSSYRIGIKTLLPKISNP